MPYRAGYEGLRITDAARSRPVHLDIWYPTTADETAHRYGLSAGRVALRGAIVNGRFPVILLSHGALGATSNYAWIGEHLARSGFIVVGVSHFGESLVFGEATVDPATIVHFGARTRDLSSALDVVLQRSPWASAADAERVGAIGHSSGGATVAMLAGGRYSAGAMAAYCQSADGMADRGCRYPAVKPGTDMEAEVPIVDARVRALVLLDPAVGPGFDRAALSHVTAPALVVGSVDNDFIPFAFHAGRYAAWLPNAEVLRLEDREGHFVYLDECSAPVAALGIPICTDRAGVTRADVHARLRARYSTFSIGRFGALIAPRLRSGRPERRRGATAARTRRARCPRRSPRTACR